MSLLPTIPMTELRRLRRLAGDETIEVTFDAPAAEERGHQVWTIWYRMTKHSDLLVLGEWPRQIDGYIEKMAESIRAANYSVRDAKQQNADFDRVSHAKKQRALQLRNDMIQDATDYSYEAWKALVDGRPSVGSCRAGSTGKA